MTDKQLARFFKYVIPEPNTGCWLWTARCQNKGYGIFWMPEAQKQVLAHRVMYLHARWEIPEGHELDHLCGTPSCVNPDHLEPVTHRENCRRGDGFGGKNAKKTHCPKGHLYDEQNTARRPSRYGRYCMECNRIRATTHYYLTRKVSNQRRLMNPRENAIAR